MNSMKEPAVNLETISNLCKRRGFVTQSSEIYGGFPNVYDYGPLGSLLKNNIKDLWIRENVEKRDDMYLIDGAVLMSPRAWEASGHVESFTDPMIDCKKCKKRFRADQLKGWEVIKNNKTGEWTVVKKGNTNCPSCGGKLMEDIRVFNLMMETYVGAVHDKQSKAYLKPEACQNIYLNYEWVKESMRAKLPFGIAQIGKAFRNELTQGQFIFRLREFEQMDIQYFVAPGGAEKAYKKWKDIRMDWYLNTLGISKKNLNWRRHDEDERIFYARDAWDIDYQFPFGWKELEGVHDRSDYDLKAHGKASGKELAYFDTKSGEKIIPNIVESSVGLDRIFLVVMFEFYREEEVRDVNGKADKRIVMKFPEELAPIKSAVLPLMKKPELVKKAKELFLELKNKHGYVLYDEVGSIGKRYRRQDEIGTPKCYTIDFQTLEDDTVTLRDRDSMKQQRVKLLEVTRN